MYLAFVCGSFHIANVSKVHPCCSIYRYFIIFRAWVYSFVWLHHTLSIHDGHLDYFHFGANMSNVAVNSYVHVFVGGIFLVLLGIYTMELLPFTMELLGHRVTNLLKSCQQVHFFTFPPAMLGFLGCTLYYLPLCFMLSKWEWNVSHCGFHLNFPNC
jgi:hypothetical protein